jgi:hemolysin activation/secretion protein
MLEKLGKLKGILFAASMLGGLPFVHLAYAQALDLPGSADPSRVIEDLELPKRPNTSLESEAQSRKAIAPAPAGTENLTFVLHDLQVDGMSAYDPAEIAKIYDQYLGTEISVATLFEIMAALQQKYLDDGFALTKVVIPNQNIQAGNVRLAVIEGHIQTVEMGAGLDQTAQMRDAAKRIVAMRPLNVKKLERVMLVLNDLPDVNVSAIIANDPNALPNSQGAVRLILQKNQEKLARGGVAVDNHGSAFTGPLQIRANGKAYNIGVAHSELGVTAMAAAPFQTQRLASASYTVPLLGASGTKATFSASKARTEPGSNLSTLDIKGASESIEASISYPIIRQRDMTLTADAGFEWKNARTKILGEELYDDRLRIAKASLNLNFTDSWAGYNLMNVQYAQGLDLFGIREKGSVYLSREDGNPKFKKFDFMAGRLQALPHDFEVLALVTGQYSYDPLFSSEEFGFGGAQMGRGYDSSEITGDRGIAGTLELRYKIQTQFFNTALVLQPYTFYDIGKIWNIDEGAKDKISAVSAGFGIRIALGNEWNADFNLSKPLTKSADNEPKYQNDLGARALFSISKSF